MAISYPRELPDYKLVKATFNLVSPVASVTSHAGNKVNLSQIVDPTWTLDVQTVPMWAQDKRAWSAWKQSLRGGLRQFVAYDPSRNPPAAYPNATTPAQIGAAWTGTATVTSLGLSGALGLSALPAGYKATAGDRVSLEQSGAIGYYEILEDATANGDGAVTLTVAPFLHTSVFTTAAVARLWQPKAKFVIDWQSWTDETSVELSAISFRAFQRVMA